MGLAGEQEASEALGWLAPGPDGAARYRAAFASASPNDLWEVVHSDWLFRMPSLHLAEAQVRAGASAFGYELTSPAPGFNGVLGACHGLDVPLVFGNLDRGQSSMLIGDAGHTEGELLSAQLRSAWAGFARCGNPGWPAYEPAGRLVRCFDLEPAVVRYPEEASRLIWQDHTFTSLPLLGE